MRFTVHLGCDGAAFEPHPSTELVRILRNIADRIEVDGLSGFYETVLDNNGNDVGRYAIKEDDGGNWNGK